MESVNRLYSFDARKFNFQKRMMKNYYHRTPDRDINIFRLIFVIYINGVYRKYFLSCEGL